MRRETYCTLKTNVTAKEKSELCKYCPSLKHAKPPTQTCRFIYHFSTSLPLHPPSPPPDKSESQGRWVGRKGVPALAQLIAPPPVREEILHHQRPVTHPSMWIQEK